MPDIDHLISSLIQIPLRQADKRTEKTIKSAIILKFVLAKASSLLQGLDGAGSEILQAVHHILGDSAYGEIRELMDKLLDPSISMQKTGLAARNERCHAVRSGFNTLLDVARRVYTETIEDINDLCRKYREEHQLDIDLKFTNASQFYLRIPLAEYLQDSFPEEFLNLRQAGKYYHFTSLKMVTVS